MKDGEPIWRGVIQHVETEHARDEKPVYFDHLDKMRFYFARYLEKLGIKIDSPGR
jgi:hypothetical protein